MKRLQVFVIKCENGYYIRICRGFWDFNPQRFITRTKLEIGNVIHENWREATEEEKIKDQIV